MHHEKGLRLNPQMEIRTCLDASPPSNVFSPFSGPGFLGVGSIYCFIDLLQTQPAGWADPNAL